VAVASIQAQARRRGAEKGCPFRWWECRVERQDTRGIGAQRKEAQDKGRKLAKKLTPGMFVAVQDRENQGHDDPYCIGITVAADRSGGCIVKEMQGRETIDKTRYDPGDCAIAVVWLERLAEDPERRTFELVEGTKPSLFNSTELRCIDIQMEKEAGPTPVIRRKSRRGHASSKARDVMMAKPDKYRVPTLSESVILASCW